MRQHYQICPSTSPERAPTQAASSSAKVPLNGVSAFSVPLGILTRGRQSGALSRESLAPNRISCLGSSASFPQLQLCVLQPSQRHLGQTSIVGKQLGQPTGALQWARCTARGWMR